MTKEEYGVEIHDNGMWEEFYQKRGNWTMYDLHKSRRLLLTREYREKFHHS
jgi:hypothetical protein